MNSLKSGLNEVDRRVEVAPVVETAVGGSFGQQVRYYRRQSGDPLRGGMLTQERLGELIGVQMGDAGYSGAAVSEWERGNSKIHADDRLVLLSLLSVLVQCDGLSDPAQADDMLAAGNYRRLDTGERGFVFPNNSALEVQEGDGERDRGGERSGEEAPSRRSKQLILLEKVHSFWVEGVLEKSIQGAPLIDVPRTVSFEAVEHPWAEHLGTALIVEEPDLPAPSIHESYGRSDGGLLILGQPGSGKTMTLISLAAELINRAREDWREPVPVILDLATWARLPLTIAEWAVEEVAAKYQIPRRYGRKWLAAGELILLLDGLDNLPLESRQACITAINLFRKTHGLTGVAVCSRTVEYFQAERLLALNGALSLQPLGEEQLKAYLVEGDEALAGLGRALEESDDLREMAHNPLMLNIMTVVFRDVGRSDISAVTITVEILFDAYVQRMFAQRAAHEQYTQERTVAGLAWLAGEMNAHNQTIFLIEKLQPSWLPGKGWRRLYMILAGAITGCAGGLIMWLLWRLLRLTVPQLPSPTSATVAGILGISLGASEPLTILLANLALGSLLGITLLLLFEYRLGQPLEASGARRQRRNQVLLVGVETAVTTGLFVLLFSEPLLAVAWGVAEGFMYASAARYIFGWSYQTEVRTVEAIGWSWRHAATGALIGLVLAFIAELLETLLYGYNGAERTSVTLLVAGFILGGLRGRSAEAKSRPNQGVWLSLRNSLIAAFVLSMTMAALAWLIRDAVYAWQIALLSAVIAAAIMGGSVFAKHFLLRAILRYKRTIPWRYARFLDYAAQLVLLRKVGNGYIFIHGLMQSYFAETH